MAFHPLTEVAGSMPSSQPPQDEAPALEKFATPPKGGKEWDDPAYAHDPQSGKTMLKSAYEFMGGAPGLSGAAAAIGAGALAPETMGLSIILPALAAGGTAGLVDFLRGGKDPVSTGLMTGGGEALGGVGGKILGGVGSKIMSKFEMGKYIGNIGKKLGEVFQMGPLKDRQAIYNAIHLGEAEKAISRAYQQTQDQIFAALPQGPATELPPRLARRLNTYFSNHLPEVKEQLEQKAALQAPTLPPRGVGLRPGQMTQAQIRQQTLGTAADPLSQPLTAGDAMEYARLMTDKAARSKKGGGGHAVRQANRDVRRALATALDNTLPNQNLGRLYTDMNYNYAQGRTALGAFSDVEKLFNRHPKRGPELNRVEWQKASDDALKRLREFSKLEQLDEAIRYGRPPGYVGKEVGGHARLGIPVVGGLTGVHPGTWINLSAEQPLRPAGGISPELLSKILGPTGAAIGAGADY